MLIGSGATELQLQRIRGRTRVASAKGQKEKADSASGRASRDDGLRESEEAGRPCDEEDSVFIPSAEPHDPPIIDTIAERHRLAMPKELGLNVHGNSRPATFMAPLGRTVNPPSANRR
jgi:hypothetical protein